MEASAVAFVCLFALLFLGVPIAFGMGLVGIAGFALHVGWNPAVASLGQITIDSFLNYGLSVLPLFLLMGALINHSKLSDDLYAASNAFVGHLRGGLAIATIFACGGFSAVSGSSLATAATMARIAVPSMRRYGYSESLAAGTIAAGGTLGILIPPSIILVIYGNLTETDIGKLFIAGVLPGMLGIALYSLAVSAVVHFKPEAGPAGERHDWSERLRLLRRIGPVATLFLVILGGIYFGVFTPTEAAGIGAFGAFVFTLWRRVLGASGLVNALVETAETSGKLMIMIVGAALFSNFINIAGIPDALSEWVRAADVAPVTVILMILAVYIMLGCMLDGLSIVLLTVPLLYPIVQTLGFDLVWFGILVVVAVEVGLITPPIGLNVFVIKSVMPDLEEATIFKGVAPFIVADIIRLSVLVFVPGIALFLPSLMR